MHTHTQQISHQAADHKEYEGKTKHVPVAHRDDSKEEKSKLKKINAQSRKCEPFFRDTSDGLPDDFAL